MMLRRLLFVLFASLLATTALRAADKKPRKAQVYMFGFAASLADSVCVITDLQQLEVYLQSNGFLADRSLYSLQLNNHLSTKEHMTGNLTCAVFFNKNKAKAEKRLQKVSKRYRTNSDLTVRFLGKDEFTFETEEWVEPYTAADAEGNAQPTADTTKKRGKKKKK